ncbi:RNA polymerase RpoN-/SigL-like sigma 54 subunit [Salsuginibacillus halophilus]|uniref:RNA polymerase RpoN-/SigL-like sigma 54 subunit n=1 Tax=Salsuginibacillus halophilus TaxID=517424 RepID=A0A2P8HLA3_9BACI|nr:RNA polymerase factor sigma-54 [Salsuginibacillus halophilus]PSL46981.1 RNA polymerase RpoN-/SigL-like sigma 54 subunit [Salsuginibacillus halophilus]
MMHMDMSLVQQQTMKLVMTQELRQAISLLQYSTLELNEYIEELALENPLLDVERGTGEETVTAFHSPVMWQDGDTYQEQEDQEESSPFDRVRARGLCIAEDVVDQIRMQHSDPHTRTVLIYLARHLGDDGYLYIDLEEAKAALALTDETLEQFILELQACEPAGVGARSLSECLARQLERQESPHPLALQLVRHYLNDVAERRYKQLAKKLDVRVQDIQEAHDVIKQLEPRPGVNFDDGAAAYVLPDVHVEKAKGEYHVTLHDGTLPKIRMNRQYRHLLEGSTEGSSEAYEYAKKKYQQLTWLLKSIDQRQQTLYNVTCAIVEAQKDFFEHGPGYLKPLTLKQIAEEAEVHESTVSRATTQKYVQTPRGLFELKDFFTSKVDTAGAETSANAVKSHIQTIVDNENKQKPLSDQKIVDMLKSEHEIEVSRRAIAKYRDELFIPSSSKRKRYEA